MARRMAGHLYCPHCQRTEDCPPVKVALYQQKGWPTCCLATMRLIPREGAS